MGGILKIAAQNSACLNDNTDCWIAISKKAVHGLQSSDDISGKFSRWETSGQNSVREMSRSRLWEIFWVGFPEWMTGGIVPVVVQIPMQDYQCEVLSSLGSLWKIYISRGCDMGQRGYHTHTAFDELSYKLQFTLRPSTLRTTPRYALLLRSVVAMNNVPGWNWSADRWGATRRKELLHTHVSTQLNTIYDTICGYLSAQPTTKTNG